MKNKHVGFVVELEIYEKLHAIAASECRSLSNLLYRIIKKWLRKHSSKSQKKAQGR